MIQTLFHTLAVLVASFWTSKGRLKWFDKWSRVKSPAPVMAPVQIDIFDYLEKLEQHAAAGQERPMSKPASADRYAKLVYSLIKCISPAAALKMLRQSASDLLVLGHNLFGIACWVNVYTVTRSFGGREAGGWYYLRYTCEKSRQVGFWEAQALRIHLQQQFSLSHKWGDLQTGGQDVVVYIEPRRAARTTKRVPRFQEFIETGYRQLESGRFEK